MFKQEIEACQATCGHDKESTLRSKVCISESSIVPCPLPCNKIVFSLRSLLEANAKQQQQNKLTGTGAFKRVNLLR